MMKSVMKKIENLDSVGVPAGDAFISDLYSLKKDAAVSCYDPARLKPSEIQEVMIQKSVPLHSQKYLGSSQEVLYHTFRERFLEAANTLKKTLEAMVVDGCDITEKELLSIIELVIKDIRYNTQIIEFLKNMRDIHDVTYSHSLCVALICYVYAKWLGWDQKDRDILVVSALLHDIGKIKISPKILEKEGALTEEEFEKIKQHPRFGYEMVLDKNLDERIKNVILMHHERNNGSGYPNHLQGEQIEPMAAVVAIVDAYDAMTRSRPYHEGICPFEALDTLNNEGNTKFKYMYLRVFLEQMTYTYINEEVELSNDIRGRIIAINDHELFRPIIVVNNQLIDLSRARDLQIQKVIC